MSNNIVEFSPGLRTVLQKYCEYRGWNTVAPGTAESLRELVNRAGSVEETLRGLQWFFSSRWCDDWVIQERPNLGVPFLLGAWDRFEIAQAEWKPRSNYYSQETKADYQLMRAI